MNTTPIQKQEPDRLSLFIRVAGGLSMAIGVVVLAGRLAGVPIVTRILEGYIPMAVATAILSAGYGLLLLSRAYNPAGGIVKGIVLVIVSLFTLYAFLKFLEYFLNTDLTLDSIVFPVTEKLGNFPVNRTSPITGLLFFLCGVAVLIRMLGREKPSALNMVGGLGAFVAFSGFTGLIGYLLGTPLLYGGDIIPLSFLTTIVLFLLGCVFLAMSGPNSIFLRRFSGTSPSAKVLRVILPIIILALLAEDLLETALSEVYSINSAVIHAVMLLLLIALTVFVVIRSSTRIFRQAEKAEEERLIALEKLSKQYEFLQSVIESLPHPFYVINPHDYSVVMGNSASGWESKTSRTTCYGLTHGMNLPCSSDVHHTCPIDEIRRTHKPGVVEHIHIDKEGNQRNVEVHAFPILDAEGKLSQIIEYSLDITDRKKVQETLIQSTLALQESNQTKDKFFSIIAHDLKSPFNAILGLTNALIMDYKDLDDKRIEYFLTTIRTSSERAFELLENLLIWANAQTGHIEFHPQSVNLKNLIDKSIALLDGPAANKGIRLESNVTSECQVLADSQMIQTVFRNLISNAVKFTPFGGSVLIEVKPGKEGCEISVSDSGIGISKEDIDNVFRIDSKHSTRGTADEKGTGLGLILCKEFVEKHGGKIWAESEEGKGSTFYFTLSNIT